MKLLSIAALAAVALLSTGCVMKSTHDQTLQELNTTRSALSSAQQTIGEQKQTIGEQQQVLDQQKLSIEEQQKLIDEQKQLIAQNREELEKNKALIELSQKELSELDIKKEALQKQLAEAQAGLQASQAKLETMRQIEAETQKRNAIYARFVEALQKMIDGGQLTVTIEQGRIVINLPNEVLFASGSSTLNKQGQEAVRNVAAVLKEFSDRRFQIEGHTDDMPIKSERFPSNWELSTARALSVVHLMTDEGVATQNVSAAGYGEFHPRAGNDTREGRALNRRIEIVMLPNLDILSSELPKVAR